MADREMSVSQGSTGPEPRHREAAAVILYREQASFEIYWVTRAPELAYLGGFHAFPGGGVSRRDRQTVFDPLSPEESARRTAAAREIFEEIGVLLVRAQAGGSVRQPNESERLRARETIQNKELDFEEFLTRHGLQVDAQLFHPAGRWISPAFSPRGFDTYFYLVLCPDGETPSVVPGELVAGEWIDPADALAYWRSGTALLAKPIRRAFEILSEVRTQDSGIGPSQWANRLAAGPEARGGEIDRIEIVPGAVLLPVKTQTLPPATHTNCLILGSRECLLVDPGSGDPEVIQKLLALLDRLAADGRAVSAITATHHHSDHTSGVQIMREKLGVPVLTHPMLADDLAADRILEDGETLQLAGADGAPWNIEAHFMPGHTQDSVVFFERSRGVLAAGDLLSGLSTVIIDPPDGNLQAYLESLNRLKEFPTRLLLPGHGPPMGGAHAQIDKLIEHRHMRGKKILQCLGVKSGTLEDLLPCVYDDVPEKQWEFARRSLLAHLLQLEIAGLVAASAGSGTGDANRVWNTVDG